MKQGLYRLPKSERGKYQCEEDERFDFDTMKSRKCTDVAEFMLFGWRFGHGDEPTLMETQTRLCKHCANVALDNIAEMEAEAAMS
jgi:hypothetical protein